MIASPVVAAASGATLPAQTSRPVGVYVPGATAKLGGTFLAIAGVAAVVVVVGFAMKGSKRSR